MTARGQALSEMLVVLLGLIPFVLALLSLAGLQDLASTTQAAARYAAFDRALAPEGAPTLAARVRQHVFDAAPGPVSGVAGSTVWRSYPGLWIDPITRGHWIDQPSRVTVSAGRLQLGGVAGRASDAALALVAPSAPLAPGRFDVRTGGSADATVRAPLSGVALPFLPQPFVLAARASVLEGAWAAEGARHVTARVRGAAPLRVLSPVSALVQPLAHALVLFEPRLREFCPGEVAPDVVPADRLSPRVPVRAREYMRC
jgi:hypothetical protein